MLRTVLLCLLVVFSTPALALYKCKSGDNISYSDEPCPGGKALDIGSSPSAVDTAKARQQTAEEEKKLKRLENERRKHEAQEEKERQRVAYANATKQKRCNSLARRKRWAEEDTAKSAGKSNEKAKLKTRRIAEQFEEECGK
jgi:hypothetical protein